MQSYLRREHGQFAFHWEAHGNHYGIGREIYAWRKAGLTVVVSGSREHFLGWAGSIDDTYPVLITAPAERLAERLARAGAGNRKRRQPRGWSRSEAYDVDGSAPGDDPERRRPGDGGAGLRQLDRQTSTFVGRPTPSLKRSSTVNVRSGAAWRKTQRSRTGSGRSTRCENRWRRTFVTTVRSAHPEAGR